MGYKAEEVPQSGTKPMVVGMGAEQSLKVSAASARLWRG
jgi:hypothetical protein